MKNFAFEESISFSSEFLKPATKLPDSHKFLDCQKFKFPFNSCVFSYVAVENTSFFFFLLQKRGGWYKRVN